MTLYDLVFSSINTPLTILLIVLTCYRLLTLVAGLDFDFDLDFDIDVDIDTEIEATSNIELKNKTVVPDTNKDLRWWQIVLIYFNFTELPFMFTMTAWVFFWWLLTVSSTYITGSFDNSFGLILFLACIIPSLILNKLFTTPFKKIFQKLEKNGVESLEILGRTGTLESELKGDKMGRIKIKVKSDPIVVYVKSMDQRPIAAKTEVLIIQASQNNKYYYVQKN